MKTASNSRVLRTIPLLIAIWCCGSWAANVEVIDQELNLNGQGYTVLRVWGSYYEMGYAHAHLLGDYIVDGVNQTKAILGTGAYDGMRQVMAQAIWMPSTIENELDGMVDSLASTHPEAGIDKLALKVFNTLGDWAYACRSHMCWGRYVSAPIKTLATRRLDFGTLPDAYNHHMLCALDPNDGSPRWLNLAIPGYVVVVTGLNEYGTIVSSHDYQSQITDRAAGRMSRLVAFRHALTFATDPDVSTHLDTVFVELQNYEIMTASFLNYYVPEGLGGVMVCNPNRADADFYYLRRPQPSWHHGDAIITTNDWTDGTFTPADEDFGADAYYNDESPKIQESHWDLLASSGGSWNYQMLSVAYRGRENMTIWADGRLDGISRTPRLEYEWSELFHTQIEYSGGTGEPNDPYRIATAEDLMLLGESPEDYDKHFILTADIDLDPNLPGRRVFDRAVIAPDFDDPNSNFDVTPFTGVFDGNNHTISHLTITGGGYLGLFGQIGSAARISNLGLEALDVSGTGGNVGGLVGRNECSITSSYSTGTVSGDNAVGGLVGWNWGLFGMGMITSSYSTASVSGGNAVGGLVGENGCWQGTGSITYSYSTGTVNGNSSVGGLVGSNGYFFGRGSITMSYSTGTVNGNSSVGGLVGSNGVFGGMGSITSSYSTGSVSGDHAVGGLVGENHDSITSSYSTGTVSGEERVGGLVGSNAAPYRMGSITSSFWDIQTSGQTNMCGYQKEGSTSCDDSYGKTTAEMQNINTYLNAGWDFVEEITNGTHDFWQISPGEYPRLRWQDSENLQMPEGSGTAEQPYLIRDATDLGTVWLKPLAHYRLETSLDLSGTMWCMAVVPYFAGTFDGGGHAISNLHIQGGRYLGLFGQTSSGARISNLDLEAVDVNGTGDCVGGLVGCNNEGSITSCYSTGSVSGRENVGGLVGENNGSITTSFSSGTVSGNDDYVGGLVAKNWGSITTSYSTASVSGGNAVGGLVGENGCWQGTGSITYSYSTGSVSGNERVGGLVGSNYEGTITTSYSTGTVSGNERVGGLVGSGGGVTLHSVWDMETSGFTISDGGVGLTTSEMMDPYMLGLSGFANDPNWVLDAGRDYPRLAWEGTAGQIIPEPIIDWLDGQGTEEEPYRVDTADQLIILSRAGGLWDKHFILGADINLDPNLQGRQVFSQAVIQVFSGVFDGNDHKISHLTIRGGNCLGLFGQTGSGARISDLGLEAVDVNGTGSNVGGLVGSNRGSITTSYSTGSVSGWWADVGGLAGLNEGSITASYSTGSVRGDHDVGGLAGWNEGSITSSYSTDAVNGRYRIGGLVGYNSWNDGSITMSYSTGSVSGDNDVGGLVGNNRGSITTSYSTGSVTGDENVGGLVGYNHQNGSITSSFWDVETSGLSSSDGGIAKTTAEMQTATTFLEAGWDFMGETANGTEDIWWIDEGKDYPRLWWEYGRAFSPHPSEGACDVSRSPILRWIGGGAEFYHDVYFADDEGLVANATTASEGTYRGRQAPETTAYAPGILEWGKPYYWRIDEIKPDDLATPAKGNVWSFTATECVRSPHPLDGSSDVPQPIILTWVPGESGLQYYVYFGENESDVTSATLQTPGIYPSRQPSELATYDPGILKFNTTYYWRIDGVDEADPNSPWKGDVWRFTTADYIVVSVLDDFESYASDEEIQAAWPHNIPPSTTGVPFQYIFVETGKKYQGAKGMRFEYQNQFDPFFTEATRTFDEPQDWTIKDAATLDLNFRGEDNNVEQAMSLIIEDAAGNQATVAHPLTYTVQSEFWRAWDGISLADIAAEGVDLTQVKKLTIRIGDGTSSGQETDDRDKIYIDDIRLTKRMS